MPKRKPPGKKPLPRNPEGWSIAMERMRSKLNSPDRLDYARTIKGRGDTHALDGGRTSPKATPKLQRQKMKDGLLRKPRQPLTPQLPVWQDRDVNKRGSKLGG